MLLIHFAGVLQKLLCFSLDVKTLLFDTIKCNLKKPLIHQHGRQNEQSQLLGKPLKCDREGETSLSFWDLNLFGLSFLSIYQRFPTDLKPRYHLEHLFYS